jgi:hypothetical protein
MRRLNMASNIERSRGWPFRVVAVVAIAGAFLDGLSSEPKKRAYDGVGDGGRNARDVEGDVCKGWLKG